MTGCIAALNAGSSSIKFAIYEGETLLFRGRVEQIGISPKLRVFDASGAPVADEAWPAQGADHNVATKALLETGVGLIGGRPVLAVGHRVVHGGVAYAAPVQINDQVLADLSELSPLAPLHQPHNLAPIKAIAAAAPHIPQVACFDTAFHRQQPHLAQLFGLPREITEAGVRRYGFHGLSYEYVVSRLGELAPEVAGGRLVVAHLGNGASACAVLAGRSIASTMGFTAVDGLLMGARSGSLDPGVLLYLMDVRGMDARDIEDLIYRRSGLLGVSGVSSDMQVLQASAEPAAAEAIALFCYRIVREVGSLAAALGGIDGLIFTGGIGENDAKVREAVAEGCRWLGVELDRELNSIGAGRISSESSTVSAWVVPTDEERMVVRHTAQVLRMNTIITSN
jgi:acetate kinase